MSDTVIKLAEQSYLLKGVAQPIAENLLTEITHITGLSPFRQMSTKSGYYVGAKMTNCGDLGWVSDHKGYRYTAIDPLTNMPWPSMPGLFETLAEKYASLVGFHHFHPNACLINQYVPGVGMGLHQDKDENDYTQPIVSVSLGVSAIFQFGGNKRNEKPNYHLLNHGDVVIWGGVDRLRFHGIQPIKLAHHNLTGQLRYNLTFRDTGTIVD